ncbi:GNAT family N-acetyltransferase [Streptomyces coffeae]|uniref:GNAT family N-acetyltransferase n=1 Tax=Streptomyces coffeae TaxID=621382 RepID=A0ABS1NBZ5_9ACTN|nr:GNAT family protein [Streptomyces coffeae]MBL1097578.1 GNAT family N-acetyltransferase [Streptomyces coffeae]
MTSSHSGPTADFATKPVLVGEKVRLRPFTEEDAPEMAVILEDEEVRRFTGEPTAPAFEERRLREWYGSRGTQPDRLDLAVVDRANGTLVGEVVLYEWDEPNRSCAFRTLLGPRGRDRGLGTEATRLIVGHGFERLGLHRISLGVFAFNPRARRAYEKVGFVAEGVEREALLYEGAWIDAVMMSVLDREWAAHRGHP